MQAPERRAAQRRHRLWRHDAGFGHKLAAKCNLMQNLVIVLISVIVCNVRPSLLAFIPGPGLEAGGFWFAYIICHGWVISLTTAVYIIAVKLTSVIVGALCGGPFKKRFTLPLAWKRTDGDRNGCDHIHGDKGRNLYFFLIIFWISLASST